MTDVKRIEPTVTALKPRKRVAAYARISMESDRLNHSLSAQVSYFSERIQSNPEWIYVGVYADSGISGGDIRRRAEFQRLLDDCNAGKINIVLCKSISRFARNTVDLLETVRHLKSIGVEVRFEKENISSFSTDGELLLSILAGFSEEESRSQSENAKWAIQKRFAKGKQWHTAAYGYRWNGETFVICEEEAKAIRVIFDNFLKGVALRRTAGWLKENGHACSMPFIRYVLENPQEHRAAAKIPCHRQSCANHSPRDIREGAGKNQGKLRIQSCGASHRKTELFFSQGHLQQLRSEFCQRFGKVEST